MGICYNCNKKILPDFNVCPYCGVKLEIEQVEYEDVPGKGITIEFGYSSSQSFEFAVKSASKFETYLKFGDGKKSFYRVTVSQENIASLSELIENLKGWRNRKVYLDGEKVLWDSIFNYNWCYNKRNKSYKPELYCFSYEYGISIWGCIQTRLHFEEHSDLFTFGKWINKEGDWQFDKEQIRHHIENDLHEYRFCPAMKTGFLIELIEAFPSIVNPNKDKNWKFVEDYDGDEDSLPVVKKEYGEEETVYMKCVAPKKKKAILKEINDKLKIKFPDKIVN